MGIEKCQKCGRVREEHLPSSSRSYCFVCLGEDVNLLGIVKSLSLSGLQEIEKEAKCCICTRSLEIKQEATKSDYGHVCSPCVQYLQKLSGKTIPEMLRENKKWMVKSSLQLLGPYDEAYVCRGVESKNFSPLDEVIFPLKMSSYIRDKEEFKEAIRSLSHRGADSEETVDITKSTTQSHYGTDPGISSIQRQDYVDVSFKEESFRRSRPAIFDMDFSSWVRSLFLGIGSLVVIYFLVQAFVLKKAGEGSNEDMLRESAKKHWEIGSYKQSFSDFKALQSHGFKLNDGEKIKLSLLYLEQNQEISAKRMLESIESNSKEKHLVMARFHFVMEDLEEALKELNLAEALDSNDELTLLNKGYLMMKKGEASWAFERSTRIRSDLEELNSSYAIVNAQFRLMSGFSLRVEDIDSFEQAWRSLVDARPYLYLYLALMINHTENKERASRYFLEALNFYPYKKGDFKENLMSLPVIRIWRDLKDRFDATNFHQDAAYDAAMAMISYHLGEKLAAKNSIRRAILKSPGSDLLETWEKIIEEESLSLPSTKLDPYTLSALSPIRLMKMGDRCMEGQKIDCAEQIFKQVSALRPKEVHSLYQLTEILKRKGDTDAAKAMFYRGIGLSPRYRPLLEIESEFR